MRESKDALVIRLGALGDTIAAEPFVRALGQQRNFETIYVRADSYSEVFWNHPVARPGQPAGACERFDLTGVYERYIAQQIQMTDACLRHFRLSPPTPGVRPRLYLREEEKAYAQEVLGSEDWVAVDMGYPGGPLDRAHWPFDVWLPVLEAVKEIGFRIAAVGGRSTFAVRPPVDMDLRRQTTLRQLFAVVSHCKYFLGMGSGPMHVAQALGVKGLGVFNPRHPARCILPPESTIAPVHRRWDDPFRPGDVIQAFREVVGR